MKKVFLFGALARPAVLGAVIGRSAESPGRQRLRLTGWQAIGDGASGVAMALRRFGNAETHGIVLPCGCEDLRRLEFCLSAIDGQWQTVAEDDEGQGILSWIAGPDSGKGRKRSDTGRTGGEQAEIVLHAVTNLMRLYGRIDSAEVAQRLGMLLALAEKSRSGPHPATHAPERDPEHDPGLHPGLHDVTVQDYRRRHNGFYALDEVTPRHRRFDGAMSDPLSREILISMDAAIMLPYDPVRDRVLLLRQFRPGPFLRNDPWPWMLEAVAGRIDAGESAGQVALREAHEEAGLSIHRLERIGGNYPSPGLTNECCHCFIGLCDLPHMDTGRGGLRAEGEDIMTHVHTFGALMDMVDGGAVRTGPLMLCALWLARHRDRLRAGA